MPSKCISRDFAPSSRTLESGFARCEALVTWSRTRMQASLRWHLTYWLIGPLLLLVTAGKLCPHRTAPQSAPPPYDSPPLPPPPSPPTHPRRPRPHIPRRPPSTARQ